ncbi:unnamed protein product [Brassica oleracea]
MEQEAIIDSLLEINYGGRLRIVRMRYILNLYIMTLFFFSTFLLS